MKMTEGERNYEKENVLGFGVTADGKPVWLRR
jgi:hypothetical protein